MLAIWGVKGRTSWRLFAISAWVRSVSALCRALETYGCFGMVQFHAASEPTLCEQAKLRDDKLVKLSETS